MKIVVPTAQPTAQQVESFIDELQQDTGVSNTFVNAMRPALMDLYARLPEDRHDEIRELFRNIASQHAEAAATFAQTLEVQRDMTSDLRRDLVTDLESALLADLQADHPGLLTDLSAAPNPAAPYVAHTLDKTIYLMKKKVEFIQAEVISIMLASYGGFGKQPPFEA